MQAGATARLHEAQAAELSAQGEETVSALSPAYPFVNVLHEQHETE